MAKKIKMGTFILIPTEHSLSREFFNAIDKEEFIKRTDKRGYELLLNKAILNLYMVIDTEGNGWCLTPKGGVTLEEAKDMIQMYL